MPADPIKGLADLLILQQRLRQAPSLTELWAVIVNDTRQLFPYRTAVVWARGKVVAISGLPEPTPDAPFTSWLEKVCGMALKTAGTEIAEFTPEKFGGEIELEWAEHAPHNMLWLPMTNLDKHLVGVIVLLREHEWRPEEQRILAHWAGAASYSMDALQSRRNTWWAKLSEEKQKRIWQIGIAILLMILLSPIRSTVVVSGEIVPRDPMVVRAPLDGVIGEIAVTPNALVEAGDLLLNLDESALRARLDVSQQELEVAKAEYLRAEQASILDRSASAQRFILTSRIEQRSSEVDYVQELLSRTAITSQVSGLVMIPDITELSGRPVKIGEKIMTIAKPDQVELEAWLPVDDSLPLAAGSELDFYLNVAPLSPIDGVIRRIDYQAQLSPDAILAFRIRADIDADEELPRIGLRGSARIYGDRVTLFYYLMRKPLAYLRQVTGL